MARFRLWKGLYCGGEGKFPKETSMAGHFTLHWQRARDNALSIDHLADHVTESHIAIFEAFKILKKMEC